MAIGEQVRKWRIYEGLSQGELGSLIDITQSQVSDFERGRRWLPVSAALALQDLSDSKFKIRDLVSKNHASTIAASKAAA